MFLLPWCSWLSTIDFESIDPSSNLGGSFLNKNKKYDLFHIFYFMIVVYL